MKDFKKAIILKAFSVLQGTDYNRVAQEMRENDFALFYEVVITQESRWAHLRDKVYPSLARFLKYKSMDPISGSGLVVSVFHEERCYLIEAPSFLEAFREIEGIDDADFRSRVAGWLSGPKKKEPMLITG